jgi:soluble lytic murein transglycosylase-like protein
LNSGSKRGATIAGWLGALLVAGGLARADDRLLYYVVDDNVVFTNTPGPTARPVPGMEREARPTGAGLPATVYDPFIEAVAAELGLDPSLIKAVALVESGFDPSAVSPRGAQGLMQLMPSTARHYGVTDPFDPLQNLRAGATHLRELLDRYHGDLELALAAYNAGPSAVRRYGGVPAYPETREYIDRVQDRLSGGEQRRRVARVNPRPRPVRIERRADGTVMLKN